MANNFEGPPGGEGVDQKMSEIFNKKILKLYEYPYEPEEIVEFEVDDFAESQNFDEATQTEVVEKLGKVFRNYNENWQKYKRMYGTKFTSNEQAKKSSIDERDSAKAKGQKDKQKKLQQKIDYLDLKNYKGLAQLIAKNHLEFAAKLEGLSNNKLLQSPESFNKLVSAHTLEDIKELQNKKTTTQKEMKKFLKKFINPKKVGLLDKIDKLSELEMGHSQGDFKRKNIYEDFTDPKNFEAVVAGYYGELFPDATFDVLLAHEYDDKLNATDFYITYVDEEDNDFVLGFDVTLESDIGKLSNKKAKAEQNQNVDFVYDAEGKKYNNILKTVIAPNEFFNEDFAIKDIAKYLLYKSYGESSKVLKEYFDKLSVDKRREIIDNGEEFLSYLAQSMCSKIVNEINKVLKSRRIGALEIDKEYKQLFDYTEFLQQLEKLLQADKSLANNENLNYLYKNLKYLLSVDSIKQALNLNN